MDASDTIEPNEKPVPGWVGGFSTSDPRFAYPDPDLSPIPLTENAANVGNLQRQIQVLWPEFSWQTVIGDERSRCYQMFAPDISRGGYDDEGRFWAIMCPQQGAYSPALGSLNIEVTVLRQRGWMDERADPYADLLAADMTVEGKVWFAPSAKDKLAYNILKALLDAKGMPFPLDKAHAILVELHHVGDPDRKAIAVRSGVDGSFDNPAFALHDAAHQQPPAWGVANVAVEIGPIRATGVEAVDEFNALIMEIFNLASGNILQPGNTLTWNVWFDAPTLVRRLEWIGHADLWRHSIDTGHGYPDGPGTPPRYRDGSYFEPGEQVVQAEWDKINAWLSKHVGISLPDIPPADWGGPAPRPPLAGPA